MKRQDFRRWSDHLFDRAFDLPEMLALVAWARENVILSKEESAQFPGEYDPELSPTVTILFEFMESTEWTEFFGVKSSQIGFTLAMFAAILHRLCFDPGDMILCLNSLKEIKRVGGKRFLPMLKGCKAIRHMIPKDSDQLQTLTFYLIGATIYLMGAHSSGDAANKHAETVVIDEVDEGPEELLGGESNIVDLLRDRLKRALNKKLVAFSKPRNEDGIMWTEYLTGSRHKCFLPCPHCTADAGEMAGFHDLVWENVRYEHNRNSDSQRWDYEAVLKHTYYECPHCARPWYESDKPWMLANRKYVATNLGQDEHLPVPGKMSYHTSDLYSLAHVPDSTLGHLAVEFISCINASQRRRFRRSRLGLPEGETNRSGRRTVADIMACQGTFDRGHCPSPPLIVLMGVDVQHKCFKAVKICVLEDETIVVTDHLNTLTFADLVTFAKKPVIVDDWGDTPEEDRINPVVESAFIDEGDGHFTLRVLNFCTSKPAYRLFWPAKGRGGQQLTGMKDLVEKQKKNVHNNKPLPRYLFNADAFKEQLYDEMIGLNTAIREAKRKGLVPPASQLVIYRNPESELCEELCGERRWTEEDDKIKRRKKAGSRRGKVLKPGDWFREKAQDLGDAVINAIAQWYPLRPRFGFTQFEPDEGEEDEDEDNEDQDEEADESESAD